MSEQLTDTERMERAVYHRPRWYGPIEHAECEHHYGCRYSYRWVWRGAREDIVHAGTEQVADCSRCENAEVQP